MALELSNRHLIHMTTTLYSFQVVNNISRVHLALLTSTPTLITAAKLATALGIGVWLSKAVEML